MMKNIGFACIALTAISVQASAGVLVQLKFEDVVLGTETTTLIANGDFESNGGNGSQPIGWTHAGGSGTEARVTDDTFGGLVPDYDSGSFVVRYNIDTNASNVVLFRPITLAANTSYVLSAYIWNFGVPDDPTRKVQISVDLNDASGEAQLRLNPSNADANQGYFVYQEFSSSTTGTNLLIRSFFDGPGSANSGWPQQPVGGLVDRISITPLASFQAPTPGCVDQDGDGFGASGGSTCTGGSAVDCDDLDASSFPGAVELCDGIDNDCSGLPGVDEVDNDGDGFFICENDCNDSDAGLNPDAVEINFNFVDENCDGSFGQCDPCVSPDGDGWKNHGEYVMCVAQSVGDCSVHSFTQDEVHAFANSAAQSDVGKKGFVPLVCQ